MKFMAEVHGVRAHLRYVLYLCFNFGVDLRSVSGRRWLTPTLRAGAYHRHHARKDILRERFPYEVLIDGNWLYLPTILCNAHILRQ